MVVSVVQIDMGRTGIQLPSMTHWGVRGRDWGSEEYWCLLSEYDLCDGCGENQLLVVVLNFFQTWHTGGE